MPLRPDTVRIARRPDNKDLELMFNTSTRRISLWHKPMTLDPETIGLVMDQGPIHSSAEEMNVKFEALAKALGLIYIYDRPCD